jgi:hypothetical protein
VHARSPSKSTYPPRSFSGEKMPVFVDFLAFLIDSSKTPHTTKSFETSYSHVYVFCFVFSLAFFGFFTAWCMGSSKKWTSASVSKGAKENTPPKKREDGGGSGRPGRHGMTRGEKERKKVTSGLNLASLKKKSHYRKRGCESESSVLVGTSIMGVWNFDIISGASSSYPVHKMFSSSYLLAFGTGIGDGALEFAVELLNAAGMAEDPHLDVSSGSPQLSYAIRHLKLWPTKHPRNIPDWQRGQTDFVCRHEYPDGYERLYSFIHDAHGQAGPLEEHLDELVKLCEENKDIYDMRGLPGKDTVHKMEQDPFTQKLYQTIQQCTLQGKPIPPDAMVDLIKHKRALGVDMQAPKFTKVCGSAYQVLGLLLMQGGAAFPDSLKTTILKSCADDAWAKYEPKRLAIVSVFQKLVEEYDNSANGILTYRPENIYQSLQMPQMMDNLNKLFAESVTESKGKSKKSGKKKGRKGGKVGVSSQVLDTYGCIRNRVTRFLPFQQAQAAFTLAASVYETTSSEHQLALLLSSAKDLYNSYGNKTPMAEQFTHLGSKSLAAMLNNTSDVRPLLLAAEVLAHDQRAHLMEEVCVDYDGLSGLFKFILQNAPQMPAHMQYPFTHESPTRRVNDALRALSLPIYISDLTCRTFVKHELWGKLQALIVHMLRQAIDPVSPLFSSNTVHDAARLLLQNQCRQPVSKELRRTVFGGAGAALIKLFIDTISYIASHVAEASANESQAVAQLCAMCCNLIQHHAEDVLTANGTLAASTLDLPELSQWTDIMFCSGVHTALLALLRADDGGKLTTETQRVMLDATQRVMGSGLCAESLKTADACKAAIKALLLLYCASIFHPDELSRQFAAKGAKSISKYTSKANSVSREAFASLFVIEKGVGLGLSNIDFNIDVSEYQPTAMCVSAICKMATSRKAWAKFVPSASVLSAVITKKDPKALDLLMHGVMRMVAEETHETESTAPQEGWSSISATLLRGSVESEGLRVCAACKTVHILGTEPFKRCSRCLVPYYCSKVCQAAHWTKHKKICQKPGTPTEKA